MSSELVDSLLPYSIFVISSAIAGYASYLALSVWRGLSVPIYKSRALWTAILSTTVVLGIIATSNPSFFIFIGPLLIVVLFYWLDRTIGTISRLDYLRRDLLGWRKLRFLVGPSFLLYYYPIYSLFSGSVVYNILLIFPLGYTSVVLVVGSRRTRDMTFRTHAKWFGFFLASIIPVALSVSTGSLFVGSLTTVLGSYCIYRMARSLVPVSKLSSIDAMPSASTPATTS